jgi:hypothetical protein
MTPDIERLRSIRSFPSLLKYLREELDWPIESDDVEQLTFDYEPEEIGLDPKTAAKVRYIKQLRPFPGQEVWGIFYVDFEPKRLPVVVLRRILQALVIKKRQSATKSQLKTWGLHDLLFISSYGEGDERAITFAHFKDEESDTLPSLKVIGWDAQDTALHIDHCSKELGNLRYREDMSSDQWRQSWSSAFTLGHREAITTSKALAEKMAELAGRIRKRVSAILKIESEKGPSPERGHEYGVAAQFSAGIALRIASRNCAAESGCDASGAQRAGNPRISSETASVRILSPRFRLFLSNTGCS